MSNLQTYYHFKLDFPNVDQRTGGKWLIHGTIYVPCGSHTMIITHDTGGYTMLEPLILTWLDLD